MKLNLKQSIAISWVWYATQMIFWICFFAFFVYGFILLMSSKTTDKEQMQGDAGGAVIAIFFMLCAIGAILQTSGRYPRKRVTMERHLEGWPLKWEERPVYHWENLVREPE
jgi:hypothetical protein